MLKFRIYDAVQGDFLFHTTSRLEAIQFLNVVEDVFKKVHGASIFRYSSYYLDIYVPKSVNEYQKAVSLLISATAEGD
jgi:hypothetical protein